MGQIVIKKIEKMENDPKDYARKKAKNHRSWAARSSFTKYRHVCE